MMQKERKAQQDHVHPPLYLEDDLEEQILDANDIQGNVYSSFSNEEQELRLQEEEEHELVAMMRMMRSLITEIGH